MKMKRPTYKHMIVENEISAIQDTGQNQEEEQLPVILNFLL